MLLKSIKLNNVRSYLDQKIDFPIGSLLLSGDIGSGKSTILLAVEFALFGSKPSELPASSLLRHGKNEGSVELSFELEGKNIIIKRNLKKGKNGIKQEVGHVITGGIKKELSPVEMKSQIFDLLGYPKDLVAKGKDLIYRYTVYTPQEEMKRILAEDTDTRLNTLRKVFNIDKYKKIRENSSIFLRSVKEKRKEFGGFISDLEEKKRELEQIKKEISDLDEKIKIIMPKVEKAKEDVNKKRKKISVYEDKVNELNKLRNDSTILDSDLNNIIKNHNKNNNDIERLIKQITELENNLGKEEIIDSAVIKEKVQNLEYNIKKLNEELENIKQKLNEYGINKDKAEEIIDTVSKMEKCPLCLQNVEHEHKNSIKDWEIRNIIEAEQNIKVYSEKEIEIRYKLDSVEKEREVLRESESKIELIKLKMQNIKEKKQEKEDLEKGQIKIKEKIGEINTRKTEVNNQIDGRKNVEEDYKIVKAQLDIALEEEKKLDIEKVTLEKEKESSNRISKNLEEEIEKKSKAKEKLNYLVEMQNWLENYFANLMITIERHVMLQIYREFNELFKTWFNVLIEDETISVRLDDEFTPIIEQNGYETYVENLSGGEKTAVALSYRLALNKVINDIVTDIKTKDILMLDEPTDGFSSEQLDKVRDVLDQLNMQQVVIVSHESKIESFVDNVIKVGKEEHVSKAY
ncbi:MAG: AAA family ATPase [Candidatus Woesearchaeota archaeon]|nr:AAA family ATPase [Candidatus Woesearchaeota archaeon]